MRKDRFPGVTLALLAANLWVAWQVTGFMPTEASLQGWTWSAAARDAGDWGALARSMFAHGGLLHLGFNMLALVSLGPALERGLGPVRYGLAYLGAGLAGGLAHAAYSPIPVVGASGALFGLIGVVAVLYPRTPIAILLPFPMSAAIAGAVYAVSVPFLLSFTAVPIAHVAHLGGMAFGMGVSLALAPRRFARTAPAVVAIFVLVWLGSLLAVQGFQRWWQGPSLTQDDVLVLGAQAVGLALGLGLALRYLDRVDAADGVGAPAR